MKDAVLPTVNQLQLFDKRLKKKPTDLVMYNLFFCLVVSERRSSY